MGRLRYNRVKIGNEEYITVYFRGWHQPYIIHSSHTSYRKILNFIEKNSYDDADLAIFLAELMDEDRAGEILAALYEYDENNEDEDL
jgi:hypothetical protein